MSIVNDFLPFCPNDTGTNLESQATYAADTQRTNGNQPGTASSQLNNKALRQATYISGLVAQLVGNQTNTNVNDNATPAQFLSQMTAALVPIPQLVSVFTNGTGTYRPTFYFFVASANATSGASYTHNSNTYTVSATISGGTLLVAAGNGVPLTSGTLTKATGTGDATITFYAMRAPVSILIEMWGGGAGGVGGGSQGTSGGDSTFGTLTAGGGAASTGAGAAGVGGTATVGSGWTTVIAVNGSGGAAANAANNSGGSGGPGPFGGSGVGGAANTGGGVAVTNSGSGGGGTGASSSAGSGAGGGGGAFVKATNSTAGQVFTWGVGLPGNGGSAGSLNAGGGGGQGQIVVYLSYQ